MKKNEQQDNTSKYLTTDQGVKINHTDDSLKAGGRGPTIMEDFHFREKMTHFDHERIPERVVHARGSAAHGIFQVYDDSLKPYTKARFLTDPSLQTPTFTRFSTVVGFRGSADTVRDVRGFATKFYTVEGNYDLVGNNIPIFFIQDAIKFPDLVHAIKPEPDNEIPQASAAHDNFWDFTSLMPESMHMIMWVLSDRALPRSYRMMEGFGVHTFRLINDKGDAHFAKFHWKPVAGVHSLVWDEVQKLAGKDPDFNRRDLWESIEKGNYPEYEFGLQIIEEKDEFMFDFDILDPTKIWPEEIVPVKKIGKLTLNRNPDNFFAETEQVAFHPGNVVPGIDFTNDPLLQGRLFSYVDTQLTRLGGPNFAEIPVNRPHVEVLNNQRDGFMRQAVNKGKANYTPNSLAKGCPFTSSVEMGGYKHYMEKVGGQKIRERSDSFQDHFSQATLFWNSMSAPEKRHIVEAFHFELGKVMNKEVRTRMVQQLYHVDESLAEQVAEGIGVPVLELGLKEKAREFMEELKNKLSVNRDGKKRVDSSPALSMENTRKDTIKGRKVAVLLDHGFAYDQYALVKERIEQAGASVAVISKMLGKIKSNNGNEVEADYSHITTGSIMYDAVFIPGGYESVEAMKKQGDVRHFINEAFKHCKAIGATGEAINLLRATDLMELSFSESSEVSNDMGVITLMHPSEWDNYIHNFMHSIAQHRHWVRESIKEKVPA